MRCSVARGPRFFKWMMLRESGSYALLLLQLLIALVTWSLVHDYASSRDIRLHPSTHDECLPSLEVVNWRLILLAISLGEVWGLPVKGMPSFSLRLLGFSVNSFDRPPQPGAVGHVVYALNELYPLSSFVIRCDNSLSTSGARWDPACEVVSLLHHG